MSGDGSAVLVLNAGSSSIKAAVAFLSGPPLVAQADLRGGETHLTITSQHASPQQEVLADTDGDPWQQAITALLDRLCEETPPESLTAVGHRIVHGGPSFAEPVIITPEVLSQLDALAPLAPLHQPHGLAGIRATLERLPAVPQVACFDTAFHRTCPEVARRYGLPRVWQERGIERYGFHGLSYQSIVEQLPIVTGVLPRRTVIAHLGAGASMAAVLDGQSIATTMGFTPLDGLLMATRCGSLDPGVVLHLADHEQMAPHEIGSLLARESGLLGVSGISGDMRVLLESDTTAASEAIDLFCYRAIREVGSLAAALGGVDCLVFTAGIGEHAAAVRERICEGLGWLGLAFDAAANATHGPRISTISSRVSTWVIPTDEAAVIARGARRAAWPSTGW